MDSSRPEGGCSISAAVPDKDIVSERVDTPSSRKRRRRHDQLFLMGPVNFTWIRRNLVSPADRLILILRAHCDMQGSPELKVSTEIFRNAGIVDRKSSYRALRKLEANGSVVVRRKSGCKPTVRLIDGP